MKWTMLIQPIWGLALLLAFLLPGAAHAYDIEKLITAAKAAYQAYQLYDGLTAEDAHEQLLDAIAMAVDEIEEAMASIAISEVASCADAIVYDFENFLHYTEDNQQDFARDYLHCLTRAVRLMDEDGSGSAGVDRLGRAFNIVAPLTLFAHKHLALSTFGLQQLFVDGNRKILHKLRPTCSLSVGEPGSPEQVLTCRAYNGDMAQDGVFPKAPSFPAQQARLEDLAARNTSYLIAQDRLPVAQSDIAGSILWLVPLL